MFDFYDAAWLVFMWVRGGDVCMAIVIVMVSRE